MSSTNDHDHVSSRVLERLAFDDDADATVRAHLDGCTICAERVQTLRSNRAAFLVQRPSAAFIESLDVRTSHPPWWKKWLRPAPAAVFAAGLAVAGLVFIASGPEAPSGGVKFKGETHLALHLHVARGGGPAAAFDVRDPLEPNDVLRFVADLPEAGHVAILSMDERGEVSFYYPPAGAEGVHTAGRSVVLPGAIQLDDYLGRELLIMLTTSAPVSREVLRRRVRTAYDEAEGSLEVAHQRGFGPRSVSLLIEKRASK